MTNTELIEAVAESVARKIVEPIDHRLVKIETFIEVQSKARATRRERFWQIVALAMSGPACLYTIVQLLRSL